MKNNMGDGYTVAKNDKGRTVYTSADGLFMVRATGAKFLRGASWCVDYDGHHYYALSLKDAARLVERLRNGDGWTPAITTPVVANLENS